MEQVMSQHFMDQPQPPSSFNPALSPALDAIILRALEKEPVKRFPSILEFAQVFQQALQSASNQDSTVIARQSSSVISAPFEKPMPKVPASNSDLSVQPPIVNASNISGLNWETPKLPPSPSSPIVSQNGKKKYTSRLLIITAALVGLVIISSVIGVSLYQSYVSASNPYPSYLSGNGTLAFVDSLSQEFGSEWSSFSPNSTGGACQFTGGAYHVRQQQSSYFITCYPSRTFSNFAFEVQLTITQGGCGGVEFRADHNGHFYKFHICQNSSYGVTKHGSYSSSDVTSLQSSTSSAINTGLNQVNKIAVVASGSTMTFYVNEQQIEHVQDSSYTSGLIGLIAEAQSDVAYSNARVWTL
jgi:hypothetical protein